MLVQRETPEMATVIHAVTVAAFARPDPSAAASTGPDEPATDPVEAALVNELRVSDAWIPALSFVAVEAGEVVGHVVCTRAHVDTRPALGLGPLSVHPDHQRRGVGTALMHAVIGAADALDEPVVVLLGNPRLLCTVRLPARRGVRDHAPGRAVAALLSSSPPHRVHLGPQRSVPLRRTVQPGVNSPSTSAASTRRAVASSAGTSPSW
jgi:putative acetyltransferase